MLEVIYQNDNWKIYKGQFLLCFRKYSYLNHLCCISEEQSNYLENNFNAYKDNKFGAIYFKTKEDAEAAIPYVESFLIMEELMK